MQRLLAVEILPFGVLFAIAVALLEVHRFFAALFVFVVGCAILTVRLLFAAFRATGSLKWLSVLIVCVASVVGEQYLVGVVAEAQEERWSQMLAGLPRAEVAKRMPHATDVEKSKDVPQPEAPKSAPPTFIQSIDDFVVLVGGTEHKVTRASTKQNPANIAPFGHADAIRAYVEQNRIYIDALLYYAPDKPPLKRSSKPVRSR